MYLLNILHLYLLLYQLENFWKYYYHIFLYYFFIKNLSFIFIKYIIISRECLFFRFAIRNFFIIIYIWIVIQKYSLNCPFHTNIFFCFKLESHNPYFYYIFRWQFLNIIAYIILILHSVVIY